MTRNPDKIINIVCHVTGVSIDDIKRSVYGTGQRDCQNCIDARQIAMFFIKELNPQIPHEQIAIMFNKRLKNGKGDHVISSHACKVSRDYIETQDEKYLTLLNKVYKALNGRIGIK